MEDEIVSWILPRETRSSVRLCLPKSHFPLRDAVNNTGKRAMLKLIIRYVRHTYDSCDTKMRKQVGEVWRTAITEIKILSMRILRS